MGDAPDFTKKGVESKLASDFGFGPGDWVQEQFRRDLTDARGEPEFVEEMGKGARIPEVGASKAVPAVKTLATMGLNR